MSQQVSAFLSDAPNHKLSITFVVHFTYIRTRDGRFSAWLATDQWRIYPILCQLHLYNPFLVFTFICVCGVKCVPMFICSGMNAPVSGCICVYVFTPSSLCCVRHHSKLCSSVTAYCQTSTLHPQGCHHVYTLVYTCPAVLGLYLAVVNCCQVLRRLRAQHPLRCPSWLIWGGSAVCHSLALTCWTCPCGLVREIVTMPKYKIQSQHQPFSQRKRGDIYSCFSEGTRLSVFSVFIFKLQGVRKKKQKTKP